jgi:UDP-N-acetylmuramate dehydrogenase
MRDGTSDLAGLTTLRLGGPAKQIVEAVDERQIRHSVRDARGGGDRLLVLAGGSNVVIADAGFDGTVLLLRTAGVSVLPDGDGVLVTVAAGEQWDDVVVRAIGEGWSGLEPLSGIPGSAGATPIQNVGAYGREVAEMVTGVRVLDRGTGEISAVPPAGCGFGYRTSVFKHSERWIVLDVTFRLPLSKQSAPVRYAELAAALDVPIGARADAAEVREAVLGLRARKGMVLDPADPDTYSAGSFFTNPVLDTGAHAELLARAEGLGAVPSWPGEVEGTVKISAAWLIERAGFAKGYGNPDVAISAKHTLALTNRGTGTTAALLALAREIRDGVHARFGVQLRPEPVLVDCEF